MPFEVKQTADQTIVYAWPHQSMSERGFVWFIASTATLLAIPALALVGSLALWAILPFLVFAIWIIWTFLMRSRRDLDIKERLVIENSSTFLERSNPRGPPQTWCANPYWVQVNLVRQGGPVPNYITLRGGDRVVEMGSFLSEEERVELASELRQLLPRR